MRVCKLPVAQAKRAARDAVRGFNVRQLAEQVYDFVNGGGDVLALEPLGKNATALAQKIAGIYGLRHSLQVELQRKRGIAGATLTFPNRVWWSTARAACVQCLGVDRVWRVGGVACG